jgi:hypothetical protein
MTMLNDELKQYQQGHFNSMEDIYEYSNSRDDVPQTKYLSIDNSYSDEMYQKAWSFLRATFSEAEKYPENYKEVPVHFVCSIAFYLKEELEVVLTKYNIKIGNVLRRPIDGLIAYHILNK